MVFDDVKPPRKQLGDRKTRQMERISMRHHVYTVLRDAIINGTLRPGAQLSENRLATELNVSRTPLREAIQILEKDRLVVRNLNGRLHVPALTREEAKQLYEVRSALEAQAVYSATEKITDAEIRSLELITEEMRQAAELGDHDLTSEKGKQFHSIIHEACGNAICVDLITQISGLIDRYRNVTVKQSGRLDQAVREHLLILNTIAVRDPVGAERAMRNHILSGGRLVWSMLKE